MQSLIRLFKPAARMPSDKAKAFVQDRITTHKVCCAVGCCNSCCVVNLLLQPQSGSCMGHDGRLRVPNLQ
jgi:hypothetical protein